MHIGEYVKGGVATYVKEVIKYQSKSPEIQEIYLMASSTNSDKDFDLPSDQVSFYEYQRSIKSIFKAMRQITYEIERVKPDIIHVHSTFAGVFVRLPLFFKKKKYKVVYCSHGWAFLMELSSFKKNIFAFVEKFLSIKTDKIINISFNEQKKALDLGFPSKKLELINNGISSQKRILLPECKVDSSKINLLFVGRFDRQKGLDILIDFFKTYKTVNVQLYIIGDNVLKNNQVEVPRNIINIGWVDNKKLDSYYELFDGVIIPSRWEGFGLVAVEAMKNKKPIIVSDRGALPNLAGNNNGYVFSLDNLDTLRIILDNLNKKELEIKGLNGYNYFIQNFTSEMMNKKIIKLYKQIL
ncbi:glycosyl transferase [Priestia megaterium]|uniref:glycosyltransferase n=1 Tax=Priestia megaterium TaxID=1404 RepID=UPI000BFE94F2|nr:glycosyltransferase [Priestia megaterium]PGZ80267.1 glycosyl transferase [Priestia megaterium]